MKPWIIYTDGGCTGNPGPGGWGAVILPPEGEPMPLSGGAPSTTNNRMELEGVIQALQKIEDLGKQGTPLEIHTDSRYVQQGISSWINKWEKNGWRTAAGKPVKNDDLWKSLLNISRRHQVKWYWVKGHGDNRWNNQCDALVAGERRKFS